MPSHDKIRSKPSQIIFLTILSYTYVMLYLFSFASYPILLRYTLNGYLDVPRCESLIRKVAYVSLEVANPFRASVN